MENTKRPFPTEWKIIIFCICMFLLFLVAALASRSPEEQKKDDFASTNVKKLERIRQERERKKQSPSMSPSGSPKMSPTPYPTAPPQGMPSPGTFQKEWGSGI